MPDPKPKKTSFPFLSHLVDNMKKGSSRGQGPISQAAAEAKAKALLEQSSPGSESRGPSTPGRDKAPDTPQSAGSSGAPPHVSSGSKPLPPALEDRAGLEPKGRPPAASIGMSVIDRYWHLSDVLEDREVSMSWRLRVMMAHDVSREMKRLHAAGAVHGRLFADAVLVNQYCRCKLQDTGSIVRTTDDADLKRDVLFFGVVLGQLALHQVLDLGGSVPRRSHGLSRGESNGKPTATKGLPEEAYANLKRLFAAELAGMDTADMSDNLDFSDALAKEVRAMTGFAPKESEKVPESAIKSLEELAVQCCSALSMNRPDCEAIEDWLASIVDEVGGQQVKKQDQAERDEVLWTLQPRDNEILGELNLAEESPMLLPEQPASPLPAAGEDKSDEGGYESDDSFLPPQRERRPSRLSMFVDEASKVELESAAQRNVRSDGSGEGSAQRVEFASTKAKSKRMSIKPSASTFARLAGLGQRTHSLGSGTSPAKLKALFDEQGRLSQEEALHLLTQAEETLKEDSNLPTMHAPVTVVGDLHGQYYDLCNLLKLAGPPGKTQYLFLGDYVDRGDWSCEVLFYLLALKIAHPQQVTLIRGNHECDTVSSYFGFKEECERKYGRAVFYRCLSVFQAMPIGALLETGGAGRFLCVHGGISPHVTSLDQFERMDRFAEPGMNGFLCDVLWADPIKDDFDDGHQESLGDFLSIDYVSNPARGCSFRYGYSAIVSFLASNRLAAIIRAHEVQQEGYRYHFQTIAGGGKAQVRMMPPVITVFSAPNYLGRYGNLGAFLKVSSAKSHSQQQQAGSGGGGGGGFKPIDLLEPVKFEAVAHPVPLVLQSETEKQTFRIEQACPYMPTTFETFVHRVLEFGRVDDSGEDKPPAASSSSPPQQQQQGAALAAAGSQVIGLALEGSKEHIGAAADAIRKGLPSKSAAPAMHAADLSALLTQHDEPKRRTSLEMLKQSQGVKSLIAKYSQAAAVDGINEMHPSLVQEKMIQAKKKLGSGPVGGGGKVLPKGQDAGKGKPHDKEDQPIFGSSSGSGGGRGEGGGGRRTLVMATNKLPKSKKSESWIKKPQDVVEDAGKQPQQQPQQAQPAASAVAAESAVSQPPASVPENEIEFSQEEILALQMLYLMIDRDGNDGVDVKELMAWSTAEGSFIGPEDAQMCIDSLDMDADGNVGFNDYLSFAAALKQEYEKRSG